MRSLRVSELKARCLTIVDEVSRTGEPVIILKRGRPVVCLSPASISEVKYPQLTLKGTFEIVGDIVEPVVSAQDRETQGTE